MRRLDIYIFRQLATPLLFAVAAITAIVWITQSLQRIDLVLENGEGWLPFLQLTALLIPSLLAVVVPFAVFGASVFALNRLQADSEIAVMFAAGVSKMRIAAPIIFAALIGAGVTLWLNMQVMPQSYRQLKAQIAEIRADFASAVLRSGEFLTIADGYTLYVDDVIPGGQFRGLLINDYRDSDSPRTYMAQYGALRETNAGPVLFLARGNIQTFSESTGVVDIVEFDRTMINVAAFRNAPKDIQLELTERYVGELLNPDPDDAWDRENRGKLVAEGHGRLAAPIYVVTFALVAVYALIGSAYSRRGNTGRIALAAGFIAGLKLLGILAQSVAASTGAFALIWATPAIPAAAILYFLITNPALAPSGAMRA